MNSNTIPVLYLFENVFYPETIIPLILSDDPSKTLIREAYQNDLTIALFSTHPKARGIATAGRIITVDDKREDGKLMAIIIGVERIQLTRLIQHVPYPTFEFKQYFDSRESYILQTDSIERLQSIFEDWINRHITNKNDREIFLRDINTPKKLIFNISLFIIKDIELKLLFLESTSIADRLNIMNAVLLGEHPESEDKEMAEAIKNFESLETNHYKDVVN